MRRFLVRSTLLACAALGAVLLGVPTEGLWSGERPMAQSHRGVNGTATTVAWAPLPEQMNVSALLASAPR